MRGYSHLLIIDLEATCCDQGSFPRGEMEIIEIGAVQVDLATLAPEREFQTFVRPVRHPRLTPFCTRLTSITQAHVEAAPAFPAAMAALADWMAAGPRALFASWGDFDRRQFEMDCAHHAVPYPFGPDHFNLKTAFADNQKEGRLGMDAALHRAGLSLEGTHHRGIDDARNMVRLLPWILGLRPVDY